MCIGLPMRVIESRDTVLLVEGRGETRQVDSMLVGPQEPGGWVLVHIDSAVQVLDEEAAMQINDALDALQAVISGEAGPGQIDALFADLVNRSPELPDHLKEQS